MPTLDQLQTEIDEARLYIFRVRAAYAEISELLAKAGSQLKKGDVSCLLDAPEGMIIWACFFDQLKNIIEYLDKQAINADPVDSVNAIVNVCKGQLEMLIRQIDPVSPMTVKKQATIKMLTRLSDRKRVINSGAY